MGTLSQDVGDADGPLILTFCMRHDRILSLILHHNRCRVG